MILWYLAKLCTLIVKFIHQVNLAANKKRINTINTKKKEKEKTNNV